MMVKTTNVPRNRSVMMMGIFRGYVVNAPVCREQMLEKGDKNDGRVYGSLVSDDGDASKICSEASCV